MVACLSGCAGGEVTLEVMTETAPFQEDEFFRYQRTRDPELRARLIEAHLGLAAHLARRFERRTERLEDLVQVANLALIKAIDRFEPDRGVQFSSFAATTIVGELKRHLRDKGWSVHVPRGLQELSLTVGTAIGELTQEFGRAPTVSEVADSIGATVDDVVEAMEVSSAYQSDSLDALASEGGLAGDSLSARLGADDPRMAVVEDRTEVQALLECLSPREREIVLLRFFGSRRQSEIAAELGISQMHVSRLLARSLERLREQALRPGST